MYKSESGVLVMKDGKAWGIVYEDGRETVYGWMAPADARLYEAKYVAIPTSVVRDDDPDFAELSTATVVRVKRVTTIELI